MKRIIIIMLLLGLLTSIYPLTELKNNFTIKKLQEDFKQFQNYIKNVSFAPYEFVSKKSFDKLFFKHYQYINRPLSLREFYKILVPLKARIGCGHSHLDYPKEYRSNVQKFKFPLILTFLNNRCYVKKNLQSKPVLPPYIQVISINNIKTDEIIKTLKRDISADGYNDSFKTAALGDCFQYYYANHYGVPKSYWIEFKTEETGEIQKELIHAVPCSSINYSNKKTSNLRFQILSDSDTLIMIIDSFIYYGRKNKIFFSFIDQAFTKIKENHIKNLIIDLRGNGGGDPFCASYLLSYIEKKSVIYFSQPYGKYKKLSKPIQKAKNHFSGNLFFLIDGSNFSTTGHFCSILRYHRLGTFIGTETGSTYTCNAAVKKLQLKNTKILLKLATKNFATAVKGFSKDRGIIPDHIVKTRIEDLKMHKDTVLDYTLNLINKLL